MKIGHQIGDLFSRIRSWVRAHRIPTILIVGGLLITSAAVTTYAVLSLPLPKPELAKPAPRKPPAPKYYSLLDGTQIADPAGQKAPVTAIMMENSPDARPQSGLKQAQVVYEAIAEGGITRFLCVYQQNKPGLIGPVRSLRMYYLDWAAPYQPSIAHIGGSLFALNEVRNGNYRDIDEFFNGSYYWRASDRYAPHNVYTSFEKLDALSAKKGYTSSEFSSFSRVDSKPAATKDATSVDVTISSAPYNSHYDYDAATNTYKRSQGGGAHLDREDGQIAPTVVVALKVAMTTVMEDGYRENITTTGSGQAYVFQNGTVTEATWQKDGRVKPLKLIAADGSELSLVRGQTWISAVPNRTGAVAWQ